MRGLRPRTSWDKPRSRHCGASMAVGCLNRTPASKTSGRCGHGTPMWWAIRPELELRAEPRTSPRRAARRGAIPRTMRRPANGASRSGISQAGSGGALRMSSRHIGFGPDKASSHAWSCWTNTGEKPGLPKHRQTWQWMRPALRGDSGISVRRNHFFFDPLILSLSV